MTPERKRKKAAGRRLRADAARNRERILGAAEQVFTAAGSSASTATVAQLAGLGVGTVFRHFPTKEALLEALVARELALLAGEADAVATDESGDALFVFFARVVERAARKGVIVEALAAADIDVRRLMAGAGKGFRAAMARLLARAQKAGIVRGDVGSGEVVGILMGIAHACGKNGWGDKERARVLAVVFDGLRRR